MNYVTSTTYRISRRSRGQFCSIQLLKVRLMSMSGLKSFTIGLISIGIGALVLLDGGKSNLTVYEESMSVSLLGGLAMLMCGSVFFIIGFVTNADSISKT